MKSVPIAVKDSPYASYATMYCLPRQLLWPKAEQYVETIAFTQLIQLMGRVYGPHLDMEKIDSLCGLQELFLRQLVPTFRLLIQGPQFL